MDFRAACVAAGPEPLQLQPVAASREVRLGCLDAETDELWSVLRRKTDPRWIWLAMDKQTRPILAFHAGDCSRDSAKQICAKLPAL
jgi:hypothetical protein